MNYNDFDLNFLFKARSGKKVCLQEAALTYHFKGKFEMKGLNDLSMSLIATYDIDNPKYTSLPSIRTYGLNVRMQF